jgi:2-methylcitrate dehydratase
MTQVIAESLSHQQTGHMRSAVERIAAFAAAARPEHLTNDTRRLFKRNILDSLSCAIAALQGQPFQALREQFEEYRAPGRCTLIGGGKTSADQAALFNSGLVRYVDLLDSYMAPGGLCHPSDNFGTVLAAAEQAGASGEEFMLALAVAYKIQCRFSAAVPVMAKGFNHATQLAISAAASAGKLLGLSAVEIANAIATVDNVSLACVHAEPVSQWKGFSPGMTGMRAIYAASLAKRGFEGPSGLFEGPDGLGRMFAQSIDMDWEDPTLEIVSQTVLKKYCSLIHGQPVLEAVLDLKRRNSLIAANVEHVLCDVFQGPSTSQEVALWFEGPSPGQRASRLQSEISHRGGVARRSGGARTIATGTHSGAGCAGAARTSGGPSR